MELINARNCDCETVEIKGEHTKITFDTMTFKDDSVERMVSFEDKYDGKFYMKGDEIDDFIANFKTFMQAYTGEKHESNEESTSL